MVGGEDAALLQEELGKGGRDGDAARRHCPHPIELHLHHTNQTSLFLSLSTSYFFSPPLPLPPLLALHEPPPQPLLSHLFPSSPSSQSYLRRRSNPKTNFVILLLGGA
ncbi:uncharacterized protein LOC110271525 [Arachis ipaensis]|uniref:uncharacterized protein LOC110271525 n=1 Tax=Arachis ipaensis TaxID=130454 RepID=UPI000A2B7269|nr:uncharacterized protein LOC110271525 [Arachis ipaensis]